MTNTSNDPAHLALLERLEQLPLLRNGHDPRRGIGEMCIMETVAFIAGEEPVTEMPECVPSDLRTFSIAWNDGIADDETRTRLLRPFVPALLTSSHSDEARKQRTFLALDWLVRVVTPTWLRAVGLVETAATFATLESIEDALRMKGIADMLSRALGEVEQLREQAFDPPTRLMVSPAELFSMEAESWQRALEVTEDNVREAEVQTARHAAAALIHDNLDKAPNGVIRLHVLPFIGDVAFNCANTIAIRATTAIVRAADDSTRSGVFDMLETAARESLAPVTAELQTSAVELYRALCAARGPSE